MLSKSTFINWLFYSMFAFIGFGTYYAWNFTFPVGQLITVLPALVIIVFYLIDSLYRRTVVLKVNGNYFWVLLCLILASIAEYKAFANGAPNLDMQKVIVSILTILLPFHAFLIWNLYNINTPKFDPRRIIFISLAVYVFVNLIGLAMGISTVAHSFKGRINLPFTNGIYEGGNVVALFALLSVPLLWTDFLKFRFRFLNAIVLFLFVAAALYIIWGVNARLTILIMFLVTGLILLRFARSSWAMFIGAWAFLPILMNFSQLVVWLTRLSFMSAILNRTDKIADTMTYNGRTYIWEDGIQWILDMGQGFWLGNGDRGYGVLGLYAKAIRILGNANNVWDLHSHSTMLDIFLAQGLAGILATAIVTFIAIRFYRQRWVEKKNDGKMYIMLLFLVFIMQIDAFVDPGWIGFSLLMLLVSRSVIKPYYLDQLHLQKAPSGNASDTRSRTIPEESPVPAGEILPG